MKPKYRILRVGEVVQVGDEFRSMYTNDIWLTIHRSNGEIGWIGTTIKPIHFEDGRQFRRPIKSKAKGRK